MGAGEVFMTLGSTLIAVIVAVWAVLGAVKVVTVVVGRCRRRRLTEADFCAMYNAYQRSPEARSRREVEHFEQTPRDEGSVRAYAALCGMVLLAAAVSIGGFLWAALR